MDQLKPWQMVLMVTAVLVLAGSVLWTVVGGEKLDHADYVYLIDIPTGEVYKASVKGRRGITVPAKHPETGIRTLLPIHKEDGSWFIGERYRGSIEGMEVAPSDLIDTSNWQVNASASGAKTYKRPTRAGQGG